MTDALAVLKYYLHTRWLARLRTREDLAAHQGRAMQGLRAALARSPYYRPYAHQALAEWPIINKHQWMANFDSINTAGITRAEAESVAVQAEKDRNFRTTIGNIVVGLSTGTSGARGIFLANRSERLRWAGAIMAKTLPKGLRRRERIALVLRADSGLYASVASGKWMQFKFFDTTKALTTLAEQLIAYAPTILVGPPSVLVLLAACFDRNDTPQRPRLVISSAEVLDDLDRQRLSNAFQAPVAQVYQATEGFLGATCRLGRMHLNEEFLFIEKEWVDRAQRKFVPLITDMYRHTQPVIRYRLNDILTEAAMPCPCGSPSTTIERIEGREDDVFWIRDFHGTNWVPVFPDVLSRHLLSVTSQLDDYEIVQTTQSDWRVALRPVQDLSVWDEIRRQLQTCAMNAGGQTPTITVRSEALADTTLRSKRRRIRREWQLETTPNA